MLPKLFQMFKKKEISKAQLIKDIIAGIIVAIIALPLSIALAISSGVSPEKGLITAIFAGFVVSFLGGSNVQIGGPTGAFVVIVYGIVQTYGINGLITATIMAGIILVLMGVLRFGSVIKFVPHTITIGFTSGIAITLLSTQIKDFLGLKINNVPADFIDKWKCYFSHLNTFNLSTFLIGLGCILIIVFWGKINKTIPGSIIALIVSTLIVNIFNLPVETIGGRFQNISSSIPNPSLAIGDLNTIKQLFKPSLTIAILAAVESLLSAVVADGMINKKHDSNMELVAQGLGNIASGLFGGIPATGAIARTAANIKNGGRSPIAGMVHAFTLLLIMLVLMPLAKMIPMTTLAAILIVVSYNMGEWSTFKALLKAPKSDVIVLMLTFLLTIIFDLVIAIEVGMILSMFLFVKRISETTKINSITEYNEFPTITEEGDDKLCVYQINGPLFFGIVHNFIDMINELKPSTEVIILDLTHVYAIDASAMKALKALIKRCKKHNIMLKLAHVQEQPMTVFNKMGLLKILDKKHIYKNKNEAVSSAYEYLKSSQAI